MKDELIIILSVTAAYFLIVLAAIMYARVKSTGSIVPGLSEYFLAGRNINSFVLICTYIGSLFSAFFALGSPGFIYTHGLGGGIFITAADLFGIVFMVSFYKTLRAYSIEHDIYSPIECMSHAYGSRVLGLICAIMMMFFLSPYISMQLVGMGKFLEGLTDGDIGYVSGVGTMMGIVALYLIFGGMRAVAYTDFVQTLAIFIGIFGSVTFFIIHYWGSLPNMMNELAQKSPEHLTLPGPEGMYDWRTWIAVSIFPLATFFQPHLLTRAMMARDNKQIDWMAYGLLIALIIGMVPIFLFGLGGVLLFGEGMESNQVVGQLFKMISAISLLGLIFTGFMLVGALGAAMSTADSLLLSIGQIFTRDVALPYIKISKNMQVVFAKVIMLSVLVGAFLIGLRPPDLMGELALYSSSATCILVPTFLGFSHKHRSTLAAFLSIVIGSLTLATLAITEIKLLGFHEGFVTLVVSSLVYIAVTAIKGIKAQKSFRTA